jgi:hypothetical protein
MVEMSVVEFLKKFFPDREVKVSPPTMNDITF